MPTPSEQFLAVVPISDDAWPPLSEIATYEEVLENQAICHRDRLRSKMMSLLMGWRPSSLDRAGILDRMVAQAGDYFGDCWNGDRAVLDGLLAEIEAAELRRTP